MHEFVGGTDGASPQAALIEGPDGTLYGTTSAGGGGPCFNGLDVPGCGTVFALTPPAPGKRAWHETILYRFADQADGFSPVAGLLRDAAGNLYGTTLVGGSGTGPDCGVLGCGTVFRLSPPAPGKTAWKKNTLYSFQDGDTGAQPNARVIEDASGALLGTAALGGPEANCSCGIVFRLAPSHGGRDGWTETTLYAFKAGRDGANPFTALFASQDGSYFGTTMLGGTDAFDCEMGGCGTVFRLVPGKRGHGAWHERVLLRFVRAKDGAFPRGDLVADAAGNLYGTATSGGGAPFNGGTVWRLSPPEGGAKHWTETVLHAFGFGHDGNVPEAGVVLNHAGVVFGTTVQGGGRNSAGSIFSLTPPVGGQGDWRERRLYDFPDGKPDAEPSASLLLGAHGTLFGTSLGLSGPSSLGTVFSLAR